MITFISELLLLFISFTITLKKYITEVAEVCTSFTQVEGTWMQELRGGHGAAAFPKVSSCSPSNSQNVVIFKGSLGNFSPSSSPRCLLEVDATALTCIGVGAQVCRLLSSKTSSNSSNYCSLQYNTWSSPFKFIQKTGMSRTISYGAFYPSARPTVTDFLHS